MARVSYFGKRLGGGHVRFRGAFWLQGHFRMGLTWRIVSLCGSTGVGGGS